MRRCNRATGEIRTFFWSAFTPWCELPLIKRTFGNTTQFGGWAKNVNPAPPAPARHGKWALRGTCPAVTPIPAAWVPILGNRRIVQPRGGLYAGPAKVCPVPGAVEKKGLGPSVCAAAHSAGTQSRRNPRNKTDFRPPKRPLGIAIPSTHKTEWLGLFI